LVSDETAASRELHAEVESATLAAFHARPHGLDPIPAGLGSRRFFRVTLAPDAWMAGPHGREQAPTTAIARVERAEDPGLRPAGIPPEPALEPLRSVLEDAGLPVPKCYAVRANVSLLEDAGDTSLEAAAHAPLPAEELARLYQHACSLLAKLQRVPPRDDVPAFGRRLDHALFEYKAEQFVSWTLPWAHGLAEPPRTHADVVREAFAWIADTCARAPMRLAHRDYKAANLHVTRSAAERFSSEESERLLLMIDIQGAFLAPPEYDLVCLLRDSHVALPETLVQTLLDGIRPELPDAPEADAFHRRFTLLTLTRNGKDLSRYLYAARVRDDERYLALVPRAVATLKAAASAAEDWDPVLARLADIIGTLPDVPCEQ
jgi:aminoglycoside/choline kinase family phosphotransferase